ncbi:neuronal pentraxin-2 [Cherax quadricarinatus]|uniref:neuronal pentraxin-2 n=1 Tax=Cherax quadricarinatus TaxID=27406 RepID=UPI00387EC449
MLNSNMTRWCVVVVVVVMVMVTGSVKCSFLYPREDEDLTCAPAFSKVLFNQTATLQYLEYSDHLPDLTGFTLHYWLHLLQPSSLACPFTYYNEADDTYVQVLIVSSGVNTWSWVLQINDVVVSLVQSPVNLIGKWHHVLHSWHSGTGSWSVYLDGRLVDSGVNTQRGDYWMNRMMVVVVADGCRPELGGDALSWYHTPRRGYGGVMEARANTTCGLF